MTWLSHPYRPDLGHSATSDDEDHVREMLELVLFTSPGERVHRADFGCGLDQLIFLGNSPELALTVEMNVRAAVQRWLGDVMTVEKLSVLAEDATLTIDVEYRLRLTGESGSVSLTRTAP
jgi:phage baseplate assembly protein W